MTDSPTAEIDRLLQPYREMIGKQFSGYRNHVCRVYLFATTIDGDSQHHEKYAIAAVFHDIGIWGGQTFDYLQPSIGMAKTYPNSGFHRFLIKSFLKYFFKRPLNPLPMFKS